MFMVLATIGALFGSMIALDSPKKTDFWNLSIESENFEDKIILNFIPYSYNFSSKNKCDIIASTYDPQFKLNIDATNISNKEVFLWMLNFSNVYYSNLKVEKQPTIDPIN